ncbi:MAG: hypothetical protein ACREU8_11600 [Gammaproteobacteria bacterium]
MLELCRNLHQDGHENHARHQYALLAKAKAVAAQEQTSLTA